MSCSRGFHSAIRGIQLEEARSEIFLHVRVFRCSMKNAEINVATDTSLEITLGPHFCVLHAPQERVDRKRGGEEDRRAADRPEEAHQPAEELSAATQLRLASELIDPPSNLGHRAPSPVLRSLSAT